MTDSVKGESKRRKSGGWSRNGLARGVFMAPAAHGRLRRFGDKLRTPRPPVAMGKGEPKTLRNEPSR